MLISTPALQEVAFPVTMPNGDLDFMAELLSLVEREKVAMPLIEQRWSARSTAPMSPVYSRDPSQLFCWVGVVMYLPTDDPDARQRIIKTFTDFKRYGGG